jgi:hypothetical protein
MVREADLEPVGWTRALYAPPVNGSAGWAEGFEQMGARLWPPFAGVILMEAMKQTFAVRPKGLRARARAAARPILAPVAGRRGEASWREGDTGSPAERRTMP